MTRTGLTEREIVEILKKRFDFKPKLPLGFDEDLSGFLFSAQRLVLLKSDMLVGSTDIPPGMSLRQAARKAVVATVSDFAAKGVQPKALLVSVGLESPVGVETAREIAIGLNNGAREYGCRIIGGDTSQANDLVIDCIGLGFAENKGILRRDGAKLGDIVAVTGNFGMTSAGLQILIAGRKRLYRRFPRLVDSFLNPVARLGTGLELARSKAVTASIDSSDGLAWSLHEIARLSAVDVVLEKIPVAREVEMFANEQDLNSEDLALYGGEEYELVVTVREGRFDSLKERLRSLQRIGRVEKGRGEVSQLRGKNRVKVTPRGYEHFR